MCSPAVVHNRASSAVEQCPDSHMCGLNVNRSSHMHAQKPDVWNVDRTTHTHAQ